MSEFGIAAAGIQPLYDIHARLRQPLALLAMAWAQVHRVLVHIQAYYMDLPCHVVASFSCGKGWTGLASNVLVSLELEITARGIPNFLVWGAVNLVEALFARQLDVTD
jgi:hypothetical protein